MKILSHPVRFFLRRTAMLTLVLAAAAGAGWGTAKPTSGFIQYEETYTIPSSKATPVIKVDKLWFRDQSFRREISGPEGPIITISGPHGAFLILPGGGDAVKVNRRIPHLRGTPGLAFPDAAAIRVVGKKIGTEKIGRYQTEIFEVRGRAGRTRAPAGQAGPRREQITSLYWISPDLAVPVKVKTSTKDLLSIFRLKLAQFNHPVDEHVFDLPKGVRLRSLAEMGQKRRPNQEK